MITYPPIVPIITRHRIPSLFRLAVFVFLNFLWGWTRILYSTDYQLFGWLTIANAGLGLLVAARTNLFSIVLRIPPPILLLYHRWIGRATFVHATLHVSLTIQMFVRTDQLGDVVASPRIPVGLMAWVALTIVFLTSFGFVRRRGFELFYYIHFMFLLFVAGALYHASKGPEFLLPGLGLWAIDRIIRFSHRFRKIVVLSVTNYAGDLTKFKFEGMPVVNPGQMAWLHIPLISQIHWHPYTVASAPEDNVGTIAVRGLGGYTNKVQLLDNTKVEGQMDPELASSDTTLRVPAVKILLDGPYGIGRIQWGQYRVIAIVAGGIGITPGISIASHIINKATLNPGAVPGLHVHLLWTVKGKQHVLWFQEELQHLATLAADPLLQVSLDTTIHVTGMNTSEPLTADHETSDRESGEKDNPYGVVHHSRANMLEWFQHIKDLRSNTDVAVSLCGPKEMMYVARRAAAKTSGKSGLFYVEEEEFER
jgi:predicted ferric reductase